MTGILSGPMFESATGSVFGRTGAHYNIYSVPEDEAMDLIRKIFPEGKANALNLCFFSTSGVHGDYQTIEKARQDEEGSKEVTFLIVHSRLVCMRYGNVKPQSDDDWEFLLRLRESSWEAAQTIGRPESKP